MDYDKIVVDSHYHIYGWQNRWGKGFEETTDGYFAGRNFRALNLAALPAYESDVSSNIIAALYKLHNPAAYAHGGFLYDSYPVGDKMPDGMDLLTQYRELMEIGFDGIKMIETKPDRAKAMKRPVSSGLYEEFFAAAEKDGTHILWHVNDPAEFWDREKAPAFSFENGWFYGDGTFPEYEEIYSWVFEVMDRHPALKATFAHFFFMSQTPERLEGLFGKYPNMAVDLTPGSEMYAGFYARWDYYREFFARHAERILFGTDASDDTDDLNSNFNIADVVYKFITTDEKYPLWEVDVHGMKLDDGVGEKILGGNFLRRVGDAPRAIDKAALKRYAAKYRHMIADENVRAAIDAEMEKL